MKSFLKFTELLGLIEKVQIDRQKLGEGNKRML
jgi:hypothetical protein